MYCIVVLFILHICLGDCFFCFIYCWMFDIKLTYRVLLTTQWNSPATVSCNQLEDQMNDM